MSMRSEWTAAKSQAKTHNNNTAVKFPRDLKLGEKLDKMEADGKAFDRAKSGELNKAWAKAAATYFASALAAQVAALAYQQALAHLTNVNDVAKHDLDTYLTMHLMAKTTVILKERDRLKTRVANLLK